MKNQINNTYQESLSEEAANILGEARMVIPGVLAIFGFQLVSVFNSGFSEKLSRSQQFLHLGSIILLAISMALLMAPAAFHRRSRPDILSKGWVIISSQFLAWGMNFFMVSVALETYLISSALKLEPEVCLSIAGAIFLIFVILWEICPRFYVK